MKLTDLERGLKRAGKPVGRRQLYRYLRRIGILPVRRLRPAIYPPDSLERILNWLAGEEPKQKSGRRRA